MRKYLKLAAVAAMVMLLALGAAACGNDESREDANDVGNGQIDKSSPRVIAFNNHYPNVETKCDGFGDRIFVITHDDSKAPSITILPGHPSCTGEGTGFKEILETNEQPEFTGPPPIDPDLYPSNAAVVP